jgi:hypothetical protein
MGSDGVRKVKKGRMIWIQHNVALAKSLIRAWKHTNANALNAERQMNSFQTSLTNRINAQDAELTLIRQAALLMHMHK